MIVAAAAAFGQFCPLRTVVVTLGPGPNAKQPGGRASAWGLEAYELGLDLKFGESHCLEERSVIGETSLKA